MCYTRLYDYSGSGGHRWRIRSAHYETRYHGRPGAAAAGRRVSSGAGAGCGGSGRRQARRRPAEWAACASTVPSYGYFSGIARLHAGDYREALQIFQFEGRGAINNGQSQWIDSICYHTMIGESYFRMGNLPQALEQYTSALKLFVEFNGWMTRVQFTGIRQAGAGAQKRVPWVREQPADLAGVLPAGV